VRKPAYDEIVTWMKDYFATYNLYAQDAATVHKMDTYFAPDLRFMPYMSIFGGPEAGHHSREDFYRMLTSHPDDYEQFEVLDIFVDERRMVSTAFLIATIFASKTNEVLVKNYEKIAGDMTSILTLNTQHMTRVEEKIDTNQFCPYVRVKKEKREDMA
jgi:hypothetical protein